MHPPAHPADEATRPTKRVKLLAGAPDAAKLSWDESALIDHWTPPVRRFLNRQFAGDDEREELEHGTDSKWRAISTSRSAHLHTGFTQESPLREDFLHPPFFANAGRSFSFSSQPADEGTPASTRTKLALRSSPPRQAGDDAGENEEEEEEEEAWKDDGDNDVDFIEHSIAIHDDMRSSQLDTTAFLANSPSPGHSFNTATSFSPTPSGSNDNDNANTTNSHLPDARLPAHLAALRDLPTAAHLRRLAPQTVVVHLVAGVIAALPPRAVRTRRGAWRDLVELLVGDDTATGLKISFWFAREGGGGGGGGGEGQRQGRATRGNRGEEPLRAALEALRVQDVVLIENVALDEFRDRVFGYSLNKRIQKNQTRIELLARGGVDRAAGLAGVDKVDRVKDWVWGLVHLGQRAPRAGAGAVERPQDAFLPPDTQE